MKYLFLILTIIILSNCKTASFEQKSVEAKSLIPHTEFVEFKDKKHPMYFLIDTNWLKQSIYKVHYSNKWTKRPLYFEVVQ